MHGGQNWSRQEKAGGDRVDYGTYHLSKKEYGKYMVSYLFLDGVVSYLFFHSWIFFILFLPGFWGYLQTRKKQLQKQRAEQMAAEFLTGMQLVSTSLQAGYAVENAFREAVKELEKIYEQDAFILKEFRYLVGQIGLNRTVEALLMELGKRSHVEDIQNFAEVFYTAKRTGGDLLAIIRNTVSEIQRCV